MAFTQNVNPTFAKQPNAGLVQITTGTGSSTLVDVYDGGVNGSKVVGLFAAGYGTTAAFDVQWGIKSGATFYGLNTASVVAGAGSSDSLASANLLNLGTFPGLTLDSDGNPYLILRSTSDSIQAKTPATSSTWAAGAVINLYAIVGDF